MDHSDSAFSVVFDFLDRFLEDLDAGPVKPLEHYLPRYPGHEDVIAAEYAEQLARRAAGPGHDVTGRDGSASQQTLGPYRVLGELGHGGQGVVLRGVDTRLGRDVALKILSAPLGRVSLRRRERFRREAGIVSRLDHPAICGVFDADLEAETPYIAMRYVEGDTLRARLDAARRLRASTGSTSVVDVIPGEASRGGSGRLARDVPARASEFDAILVYFEEVARAVHAAHQAGVLHRDIKPGNLMVTPAGRPVILDFGLARDEDSAATSLTNTGEVFGTMGYMAPEQLQAGAAVDHRADVWALGVTLYETLTLVAPFRAEDGRPGSADPGIDAVAPRRLNPAVPRDLEAVCCKAMAARPGDRYATAQDLADDLRNVRMMLPIHARHASTVLRLLRRARRSPWAAGLFVATSLASGVAAWSWLGLQDATQREAQHLQWQQAMRAYVEIGTAYSEGRTAPADAVALLESLIEDPESRAQILGDPWTSESHERFASFLPGVGRAELLESLSLAAPRGSVTEARPVLHVRRAEPAARDEHLVVEVERPGDRSSVFVQSALLAAGERDVFLEPGGDLAPGTWRCNVLLDRMRHPEADGEPVASALFTVLDEHAVEEALGAVPVLGVPILDTQLRVLALLRLGLARQALTELELLGDGTDLSPHDRARLAVLACRAHGVLGDEPAALDALRVWRAARDARHG